MKTTRIILIVMLVAAAIEGYSNPVDADIAKRVAQNFMNKSRSASKTVSDVVTEQFEGYSSNILNIEIDGEAITNAQNSKQSNAVPNVGFRK